MIAMGTCKGYLTLRIICLTSTWPKGRILLFLLIEYCKVFETDGFHDSRNPSQIFHCHVLKKKHLAHFTLAVDILKYHPGAEGTNYIQHFTTLDLIGQI